jgi:hypothetical protein
VTASAAAEDVVVGRLPGQYMVWLGGALVSQVGDAALYFALGWAASGHGGPAAALAAVLAPPHPPDRPSWSSLVHLISAESWGAAAGSMLLFAARFQFPVLA